MNKRQYNKKIKKIEKYVRNKYDVLREDGNYSTIPERCKWCTYYESADYSVGLLEGCTAPALYDDKDDIIQKVDYKVTKYMELLGYGCPYFSIQNKKYIGMLKNVYKEIRKA